MKNSFIKILSVLLVLIIAASVIPMSAFNASAATSGNCGKNVTWSYDEDTCSLSISGTGAMTDYDISNHTPWSAYEESIKSVTIGDGVTTIGTYAFRGSYDLVEVTIPESVTSIGENAFSFCTKLEEIVISENISAIGDEAFYYCRSLTAITVDTDNKYYSSDEFGVLFNKIKTTLIKYPEGNARTEYTIPESVTAIGDFAFNGCFNLTVLNIPDGVVTIGDEAFSSCYNLIEIRIPENVTEIGEEVFSFCSNLESITVDTNNKYYSSDECGVLFNKDKTALIKYPAGNAKTEYTVPESVTEIGDYAFFYCENLEIIIHDNITKIGEDAFSHTKYYDNKSYWDGNVLYLGKYLLAADSISGSYTIKNGTTVIGDYAFRSCYDLTNINIPEGVVIIGDYAFAHCTDLTTVNISDGVTKIGDSAFASCFYLTTINIPDSVVTIGDEAFSYCHSLFEIILPDGLKLLGKKAFSGIGLSPIESIEIPKSVESIGAMCFSFSNTKLIVDSENPYYSSDEQGSLFNKDKTVLLYCKDSYDQKYSIPEGVTTICSGVFQSWYSEKKFIVIPDTVNVIEDNAFNCPSHNNYYNIGYTGSEEQWSKISIGNDNNDLLRAKIHFNYCEHIFELTETVEPTCTEKGYSAYTCTKCGFVENRDLVNETEHNHNAVVTAPTCTEKGYTTYTCECGDTYIDDYVDAKGHNFKSVVYDATCTEQGYTTYTCECGETYTRNYTSAKGHNHTSEITTPATHMTTGVMTYTCNCGDTYTKTIEKIATHNYKSVVTEPSCTEQGYTTYTCECSDTYVADYVDATGHSEGDKEGNCSTCSEHICDHDCHKSGIAGFIWKITLFFSKLFGANRICECGMAHY